MIIVCAPVTDVTWYSFKKEDTPVRHKKKKSLKLRL